MKKLILLSSFVLLIGCAQLEPFIQDVNVVSIAQEKEISQAMSQQIKTEMTLVSDPKLVESVQTIGKRLVTHLPSQSFEYEFFVVKDDSPNAFTIPGGKIYVHTGLFKLVASDSELAGVLAHEIGHAYERHPTKGITRTYGVDFLSKLILSDNAGKAKTLAMQLAKGGILSKYGRDDEREADSIGVYLLKKSGYNPSGLLSFLEKIGKLQSTNSTLPFLRSHPPTSERIERLKELIQNPTLNFQGL